MGIENIVTVNITRETKTVSRQGFGIPMIFGTSKAFPERIRFYSRLSAVADDFDTEDPEYKAAQAMFSQSPSPTQIGISRRATGDTTVLTVVQADNFTYKYSLEGQEVTVVSTTGQTAADLAALIKVELDNLLLPFTVTDNANGTLDIDPTTPGTQYSVQIGSLNLSHAFTTTQSITADLDDILQENKTWYSFMMISRVQAEAEAGMAWAEANMRLFAAASADANIVDQSLALDLTSIAYTARNNAYDRTIVIYHSVAATQYADAAWIAMMAPFVPGSYTTKFKSLAGISVDNLTSTQEGNALAKNANVYVEVGGQNITCDGKVGSGEYIDIIVFVDWLDVNLTADIFALLVNAPKIAFTDPGIAGVEAAIVARLQEGVANGGIAPDDGQDPPGLPYTVTVPRAADVSQADKAARCLTGVEFSAILAGAIHKVNVEGTVTV